MTRKLSIYLLSEAFYKNIFTEIWGACIKKLVILSIRCLNYEL